MLRAMFGRNANGRAGDRVSAAPPAPARHERAGRLERCLAADRKVDVSFRTRGDWNRGCFAAQLDAEPIRG